MHGGTVTRGDRETELSCDRFCGRKIRQVFTPLVYIIFCSFVIEIFTAACCQRSEGNARLATAMFTKKISSGVILCMSGAESVSTTSERTCRRIRPKATQTLTAPLLKPEKDSLITIEKYVMVILTVLQCFIGVVMRRHFFYMTSDRCVSYRRPLTGQCWIDILFVFIRTNFVILVRF